MLEVSASEYTKQTMLEVSASEYTKQIMLEVSILPQNILNKSC
jgi:hypothetical protein